MKLKEQNVLFFTRTMKLGGTENVILQLCDIFKNKVNKIVVCSCGGVNVEKLESMGIKHYEISDIENKNPKTIISTLQMLGKIVKEEKIDIIHTHHRMAAFYVSLLGLYRKCVFINTSHNTFHNKKALTKLAYKNAYLVACGEMVKKNLTDVFELDSKNIRTITNSVTSFKEDIVEEPLITQKREAGKFIIGNVGRLSEQKGMGYYIKAIPKVLSECPDAFFLIIGEGEDRAKLENLVCDLQINENVCFLGYRTDVQNLMSQLDLVVLSSLWEGFPLTPIEAFSVGKTIVATGVDGTLEIVQDGVNGLLVPPADETILAEKICQVCKDRQSLKKMEENAKKSYDESLSYEVFAQRYITLYEEKLNERA